MKGFINVTMYDKPMLLAISAIVSIAKRDNGTCTITMVTPVAITSSYPVVLPGETYEEILALLEQAQ
ncbi:MAG: hypothetical protein ACRYFX_19785 [Janthinobacterium lividum]